MIFANVFGSLALLYFLWKRLKEDYHFERIFTLGVYLLVALLVGSFASKYFFKEGWFWIESGLVIASLLIAVKRLKINFFESFEATIVGFLLWICIIYFFDAVQNFSTISFLAFWVTLCLSFFFYFLDGRYRSFTWYRSGRVGFSGLVVGISYFVIRAVIAVLNYPVISFLPKWESVASGISALTLIVLLYKLSKD